MELSELTAYAKKKYNICEQHKWEDFPGFSVLADPQTEKWIALLMRKLDTETGELTEKCDIKCGEIAAGRYKKPYLFSAFRMRGNGWIGVDFDGSTEAEVVFDLFDRAVAGPEQQNRAQTYGCTIVLDRSEPSVSERTDIYSPPPAFHDTAVPLYSGKRDALKEPVPERIRKLRLMFGGTVNSAFEKAGSFLRQAMFMREYEDDVPWASDFICYFPTYRDMTLKQLRGYFSWRTKVRSGEYRAISASSAYVYIYELLNGIGAGSPEECLGKLKEFEEKFVDGRFGDEHMRKNLHRWMGELSIVHGLPHDQVLRYADPETLAYDKPLTILREPRKYSDPEVFEALARFDIADYAHTAEYLKYKSRTEFIFSEAWRIASEQYVSDGKDLFTLCFGKREERRWYPFTNAVYCLRGPQPDVTVEQSAARVYTRRGGQWFVESYVKHNLDRKLIRGFLHATDLKIRRHLKCGCELHEKPGEEWAMPFIDLAIKSDMRAEAIAARERISFDASGLEKIRTDSIATRDSLLTPDELDREQQEIQTAFGPLIEEDGPPAEDAPFREESNESIKNALGRDHYEILSSLMRGEDPSEYIKANRIMPSIAADAINEVLSDEIGDNAVLCDDGRLSLVEDYAEDIRQLLGGTDR